MKKKKVKTGRPTLPRELKLTTMTALRFTDNQIKLIDIFAEDLELTRAEFIRQCVLEKVV